MGLHFQPLFKLDSNLHVVKNQVVAGPPAATAPQPVTAVPKYVGVSAPQRLMAADSLVPSQVPGPTVASPPAAPAAPTGFFAKVGAFFSKAFKGSSTTKALSDSAPVPATGTGTGTATTTAAAPAPAPKKSFFGKIGDFFKNFFAKLGNLFHPNTAPNPAAGPAPPGAPPAPAAPTPPAQPTPPTAFPPLQTVPDLPEYRNTIGKINMSSPGDAAMSACTWLWYNRPDLWQRKTADGDLSKDEYYALMTNVIGILRANGFDACRVVNHENVDVGGYGRYGQDAVVVNGRIYDVILQASDDSGTPALIPQYIDNGPYVDKWGWPRRRE